MLASFFKYILISSLSLFFVESGLNRVRRKKTPPIPTSSDFALPDCYRKTLSGKPFLCTERYIRNKRILLFATDK